MLAVGTKDGTVLVYILPAFELHCMFEHRKREISDLKFSPNGNYLVQMTSTSFLGRVSRTSQLHRTPYTTRAVLSFVRVLIGC